MNDCGPARTCELGDGWEGLSIRKDYDANGNLRSKFLQFLFLTTQRGDRKMAVVAEGTSNALSRAQSPPPPIDLDTGESVEPPKYNLNTTENPSF